MSFFQGRLSWNKGSLNSALHAAIIAGLVAALSYLAAVLGVAMSLPGTLSPLWPGCALLVAVLLLTRRKIWPALIAAALAGFFFYDMRVGLTVRTVVLLLAADIVEVLVAALGVSYTLGGRLCLNSIKHLATYLLFAGILAPVSGALIGAVALGVNYWTMWRISFFSEALALLTLTPAIVGWVNTALTRPPKSVAYCFEAVMVTAGLGVLGYFTFVASGGANRPVLLYSLLPFLLWSALRFGSTGTATSTLLIAFLSIWGTTRGRGPFIGSAPLTNVLSLQLFLLFAAIPFMFLAALVEEREEAAHALGESEARERTKAKELETVLEAVPVAVLIANDPKCERITANRAGYELLHLAPGANASKSALPDEQPKFRVMVDGVEVSAEQLPMQRAAATGKQTLALPEVAIFEDGTERNLIANAAPLLGENGKPYGAVAALLDVTERERAEKALRESEERFRLAAQAGKMFAYEWDIATDVIERSPEAAQILGIDELAQATGQRMLAKVHAEDRERVTAAIVALSPEKPDLRISLRMLRSDGTIIWVEGSSRAQFDGQGRLRRLVGMVADVTERKQAEEERRESESRFQLMADAAPVLIWMSGPDKLCTYFNKPWLDFTGRSIDSELGNGWAKGVHKEDLKRCLEVYTQAFDRREEFRLEYRLQRHDGEYRWILDIGVPRFGQDRSFIGYIGIGIDVTERKRAEEALSTIGRRLIEAHEEERTWIGRELHDDINQKLAMVAIEMDRWSQEASRAKFSEHLSHAKKRIMEISKDVQALSHRLHSSKLDYLGLAVAAGSFCGELSEKAKVEVQFSHSAVPSPLPREVSLCLFRVLQEALQNGVKHSGATLFYVNLRGTLDGLELTVSDEGKGFDERDGFSRQGLGLISMRERLQMVHGVLEIETHPGAGTTIFARVPLQTDELRAMAG